MGTLKIIGFNLLVYVLIFVLINQLPYNSHDDFYTAIILGIAIYVVQVLFNFGVAIASFRTKKKEKAQGHLMAAIILLVIGFSFCSLIMG